ncbi:MAG: threonylcarbamoyl-AMP synthase [Thaumarchaeota archaeon]|nr:threonylcarbamoyl-AMP synthase [Nitrososphaerota archaeon]
MIVSCNRDGISMASRIIKSGGIAVFPTDTVYGIGCDPFNSKAVETIYKIKGREGSKQLPVLGLSIFEISKIAVFDKLSQRFASRFWPGPLTLILDVKEEKIAKSLGLDKKIAVRVPNHPCVLELLKECKLLVGTSANPSGQPSAADSTEVIEKLSGYDILLDGGSIPNPVESTIVRVAGDRFDIIREGKISEKELLSLV